LYLFFTSIKFIIIKGKKPKDLAEDKIKAFEEEIDNMSKALAEAIFNEVDIDGTPLLD
jgi:uncharacterized protein Yka (UPF0111/DUF47 family)